MSNRTYQISFSGGLGSAISAFIAHENDLDYNLIFADTLIEDEDLYRFILEVSKAVGKDIVWLQDGRTPWDVYEDNRYIGNTRTAHCSEVLKTAQVKGWLEEHSRETDPLVLGMDVTEQDRIDRAAKRWEPRPVVSLLNEYRVGRHQYDKYLKRYGIRKPRLYHMGFSHNNCGGFCCKAGQKQFARLYSTMPERYKWHEERMEKAMKKIGQTARPFLRVTEDSELSYLTLREYRQEYLEAKGYTPPLFGEEGCGCFVDD